MAASGKSGEDATGVLLHLLTISAPAIVATSQDRFVPRLLSSQTVQRKACRLRLAVLGSRGEGSGRAHISHCDFVLRALAAKEMPLQQKLHAVAHYNNRPFVDVAASIRRRIYETRPNQP